MADIINTTNTSSPSTPVLDVLNPPRATPYKHPNPHAPGVVCHLCHLPVRGANPMMVDVPLTYPRSKRAEIKAVAGRVIAAMTADPSRATATAADYSTSLRRTISVDTLVDFLSWDDDRRAYIHHSKCHSSLKAWCKKITGDADLFPNVGGRQKKTNSATATTTTSKKRRKSVSKPSRKRVRTCVSPCEETVTVTVNAVVHAGDVHDSVSDVSTIEDMCEREAEVGAEVCVEGLDWPWLEEREGEVVIGDILDDDVIGLDDFELNDLLDVEDLLDL